MKGRQTIDRYELMDVLGKGAMGTVYRAWDPKLHREVALKLLAMKVSSDAKSRERFHREARAIASLRHPNVVEIYDYSGVNSPYLYLVMERLTGKDLFDLVSDRGPMPEAVVAAIGHELCLALAVAHEAGIIHRDIKPENVFVLATGRVVLTDFGVVKAVRADSAVDGYSRKTEVIGTPGFMAPELMLSGDLGPEADIFAMGALLYNIATGRLPYDGKGPMEIYRAMNTGKYPDMRTFNPQLSPHICDALAHCLHPKAKRRFRHVEMLRAALKACLAKSGVTDLRDDLRDYMQDPVTYGMSARHRLVNDLVANLKIAVKDRNQPMADDLRSRLEAVDPVNKDLMSITGVLNVNEIPSRSAQQARSETRQSPVQRRSWPTAMLAVAGAAIAVAFGAYLFLQPSKPLDDVLPLKPSMPVSTAAPPVEEVVLPKLVAVKLTMLGGPAMVFVDGERLGRFAERTLTLSEGTHNLEVRKGAKKLRHSLVVRANEEMLVTVDLRRGKMNASASPK